MAKWFSLLLIWFIPASAIMFATNVSSSTLLILGDSLSAGYQMPLQQAWPNLLGNKLAQHSAGVTVVNGSISGDTTGNGLERLPALLEQHHPEWVLIALGANDGLRGFPPHIIEHNLRAMITQIQAKNAQAIIMQILTPPNYGRRYSDAFANIYPRLSEDFSLPLIPFFLEQVIINPEWMMADGLHPTSDAQPWIANYMTEQLTPWLYVESSQ
ncbi:multifunctional acyl-CoA thioesterase I/protease I/lysophospholipase L1 [Vibrio sp. V27_P1S3P104]|uniref:multifunctional acyl-CoA thioesterase I/protease I/lysophospholipase L1 n=2 Tax=Vibrio TaxID=662 RepID=UPI001372526C|nr:MULTISPECIES: multifunctional acyl-CoA thioesterase I/protease I/lysophospholipase L1 [unclassified Vibrio]NAW68365.1 multifunctional acyl-CoA thioesterase I/protease I/lysophospholipase L1 [Vibrio sp. V28_P6S34P95]NAX04773.1 multifunctional acyl-CoA thioesterase I/protease I/lysophospholipase L1 [Vibrio sp. V30_P3S12P165]NAX35459.1 multifunctional acyl-CoA thioesterase I/protease I/lysophospholipase L1 [Vibrio sp. V29_P1S30P107]NAX37641.1 multifunctional acyl-CoA thioesterase I/protease I/l